MNPHAIPLEIEYIKIIMIIVMNPAAANTMSSQLTPFNCCAIMIPTTTNAGAVTAFVTVLNTSGDKKIDNKNKIPVVQAVRPVLPPTPTPEVDSTKLVTVLVPTIEPNTVPIASASKACSAFSNSPFHLLNRYGYQSQPMYQLYQRSLQIRMRRLLRMLGMDSQIIHQNQ